MPKLLYAQKTCANKGKYVLGLEPEESPHLALPVKYMNYESLEYDRQYKEMAGRQRSRHDLTEDEYISGFSESDRLMPVITILVIREQIFIKKYQRKIGIRADEQVMR